jgi:hypothetical protein
MVLGAVFLTHGLVRGTPDEHADCTNNVCKNVIYLWKCPVVAFGTKYQWEDCIFCSSSAGRCIDLCDGQCNPANCVRDKFTPQLVNVCDTDPQCDCHATDATTYVEATGNFTGALVSANRNVYYCPQQ